MADGISANYTYDVNSNRIAASKGATQINYTYNNQDQLLSQNAVTYTYTANGERASRTDTSGSTSYKYDAFGNLVGATLTDGRVIDYVLDGQNRRIGKKINGVMTEEYLYMDGGFDPNLLAVIHIVAKHKALLINYSFDRRGTLIPATYTIFDEITPGNEITRKINSDERGTPVQLVDMATGQIIDSRTTDEYGNILSETNPGLMKFGFAGCLQDIDTSLCHFGAREYDPETGRFLQRDPINFNGGLSNLYEYSANDPINFIDTSGKDYYTGNGLPNPNALWDTLSGMVARAIYDIGETMVVGDAVAISATACPLALAAAADAGIPAALSAAVYSTSPTVVDVALTGVSTTVEGSLTVATSNATATVVVGAADVNAVSAGYQAVKNAGWVH